MRAPHDLALLSALAVALAACGGSVALPGTTTTGTGGTGSSATGPVTGGAGGCVPLSCADVGVECGSTPDGCGNVLQCGECPCPGVCGLNGVPGKCGYPAGCTPKTCAQLGFECGQSGDGCGCLLECGDCPAGMVCGGGCGDIIPGKCGYAACCPMTCEQVGAGCGPHSDGCGGLLQCGDCPPGMTCGGGGVPGQCGGWCQPQCAVTADCPSGAQCVPSGPNGCAACMGWCDGSKCLGMNTCASDADCPAPAKCLCDMAGCTMCVMGL